RLRELRDGEGVIADAVRGALGIEHLEVKDAVHRHLHVVLGDADLLGDVDGDLLQRVLVAHRVHEGHQDVKAGVERAGELAEPRISARPSPSAAISSSATACSPAIASTTGVLFSPSFRTTTGRTKISSSTDDAAKKIN